MIQKANKHLAIMKSPGNIYLYIPKVLTECLHCARHHPKCLECICGGTAKIPKTNPWAQRGTSLREHVRICLTGTSRGSLILLWCPSHQHAAIPATGKTAMVVVLSIYTRSSPDSIHHGTKLNRDKSRRGERQGALCFGVPKLCLGSGNWVEL